MNSLGSHLQEKREESGYSIDEVAEATNIAPHYIRAIESHDFSQFPADVYAKGFIRTYAKFLDLDAQSLVMEYSLNFETDEEETETSDRSRQFIYWAAVSVLLIIGVGLVFLRFAWLDPDTARTQQPIVQPTAPPVASTEHSKKEVNLRKDPEQLSLKVVASSKTWVYAVFDGLRKKEFMFQRGDEMTWEAKDTIRVRLGNAGGLRLFHRGKPLPKLGQSGEVADKVITLKGDSIRIKTPGASDNS
ncbi:MAG: helix-turn-helix domain-containing protein [bacterium]